MTENFGGARILSQENLQALALNSELHHVVGITPTLLTRPEGKSMLVLFHEHDSFRIRVGDFSVLGSELITNGGFDTDSDWVKGDAAVTISAGEAHWSGAQGDVAPLTQTLADDTLILGEYYEATVTVSNRSAGGITPSVGGTAGTQRTTNDTFTEVIIAGASQDIVFEGDADFDGDIDDVTIKRAKLSSAAPLATKQNGVGSIRLNSGPTDIATVHPLVLSAPEELTVVGLDAGSVLTYFWL